MEQTPPLVLITGATGYVGGRLLTLLSEQGVRLRCLARRPKNLRRKVGDVADVVYGDVLLGRHLDHALRGVHTAYYLVHSMAAETDFATADRQSARHFATAARAAGVRRIVYLGGLGDTTADLSPHLASRQEVGRILAESGAEVIEFRASIVIGSGSLSFEMVRALVERLPVMITPRWVQVLAQPIAITDVLAYLAAPLERPERPPGHYVYEIGGADQVTYRDLMREYARQRHLHRLMIPVPFLTPRLSSLWLGLVTPLYARIGRTLIESIRHPTVVQDPAARRDFPAIAPRGVADAIAEALRNEDRELAQTRWADAPSIAGRPKQWGGVRFGNRLVDSRVRDLPVPPAAAFAPVQRIGGETGWYYATWLWYLRGILDLMVGGVGMKRGRRDPVEIQVGDVIDCWRVDRYVPDQELRLSAEMKLPGRAWLHFEVEPAETGSRLRQTAILDPVGLPGFAYWYTVYPLHELVFNGMIDGIAQAATAPNPATA